MIRHLVALSSLSLSAGCFSSASSKDGALPGATNLSPGSLLAEDDNDDDAGDSGVVCPQPIGEVSLAEAVDRGWARLGYDGGMFIDNEGPVSISMDGWFVFFSEASQDAIGGSGDYAFGHDDQGAQGLSIPPGGEWAMDYAAETGPAWWCIEESQITQISMDHRFNGAEAPPKLLQYVFYDTDENGNEIEDHDEFPDEGGLASQAQHNLWDTLDAGAIFVVGRSPTMSSCRWGRAPT